MDVRVWIDWNQDGEFTADEEIGNTNGNGMMSGGNSFSFQVPSDAEPGTTRMRVRGEFIGGPNIDPCASGTWGEVEDYSIEILGGEDCDGTPSAGTVEDMNVCPNVAFVLSTDGATGGMSGLERQWQESTDGDTWVDISGATGSSYTVTNGIDEVTYFRYVITCTNENDAEDISDVIEVSINEPSNCYCTPGGTSSYYIADFKTSGSVQDLDKEITSAPAGYNDFTETDTIVQHRFLPINFSALVNSFNTLGVKIWVDWNHDGNFDASETVYISSGYENEIFGSFIVPADAEIGYTRMRVGTHYYSMSGPNDACEIVSGETSYMDFTFEVLDEPTCLPVTNLGVDDVNAETATLTWEDDEANKWEVVWDTTGFDIDEASNSAIVEDDNFYVADVNDNTEYDFYVRAICDEDDQSVWSGPYSFLTPCSFYEANGFCEGFDIDESPSVGCWRLIDGNGDGAYWGASTMNPNSGEYSAVIDTWFNASNNDYLISPAMEMTGIEAMRFYYAVEASTSSSFSVLVSTTNSDPSSFTDTLMAPSIYANTNYQDTVIDLTDYTGKIYVAFHVGNDNPNEGLLYIDDVCFGECIPTPGEDGERDVCRLDGTLDLNDDIIENINNAGEWIFPDNQSIIDGSTLHVSTLPQGSYEMLYVVQGLCEADTTIATVTVHPPSSAGENGTITVCKNGLADLFSALGGSVDHGGVWIDPNDQPISGSMPQMGNIPGSYNYHYITDSDFCPNDTSLVEVIVDGTCDFLGVEDEAFDIMEVYPNPATDQINVVNPVSGVEFTAELMDMNGRVVIGKTALTKSETTINISELARGVYTLHVYGEESQRTFRIVKQ